MNVDGVRTATIAGHALRVADAQPTFWRKVEAGAWEPETLAAIRTLLASPAAGTPFFLDIGAWIGATSLFAAAEGARVLSLEADPAALEQMQANLAVNPDLAGRIEVIPKALAAQTGTLRMGARRKPGDSMSSLLLADASARTWEVAPIAPAELAHRLPKNVSVLVKLDIEGGEYALLPAMAPVLARADHGLILSFHPRALWERYGQDGTAFRSQTLAALDALHGWNAFPLEASGPSRQADPIDDLEATLLSNVASATWLFRRA